MATDTLQAESATSNHTGDNIATLFARWVASVNAYAAHPGDGDDPEWCELLDQSEDAAALLMQVPAMTIEDLAIKSYIAARHEMGCKRTEFDIDFNGGLMEDSTPQQMLIADAVRLSPLLASVIGYLSRHA